MFIFTVHENFSLPIHVPCQNRTDERERELFFVAIVEDTSS